MRRVFICSRYKATATKTVDDNILRARDLCLQATKQNMAPFAPHLLYTQILNDNMPEARTIGMNCGLAFLKSCNLMWVDSQNGISEGMAIEIEMAKKLEIPIMHIFLEEDIK